MHAEGLIQMANEQPHGPEQFKAEPNEEVQRDAGHPDQEVFQVNQVVGAEASGNVL